MGTTENLFHEARSRNKYVANVAVQPISETPEGVERYRTIRLGFLQLANTLASHSRARSESCGAHAQSQS